MNPPPTPLWRRPQTYLAAWFAWFITLHILSSLSHPGPHIAVAHFDKFVHAGFFALGGILLALSLALRPQPLPFPRIALAVLAAGTAIGALDEWHQTFTPGRQGLDLYDWLADILGSLLAPALALPLRRGLAPPAPQNLAPPIPSTNVAAKSPKSAL